MTAARTTRTARGWLTGHDPGLGALRRALRVTVAACVGFFLCEYVEGSTADHDHEVDEARWIPLADAPRVLSYTGERALIQGALSKLASGR